MLLFVLSKYSIILSPIPAIAVEVKNMAISYKKLWKLLIDKDMKKKDLQVAAGMSGLFPNWPE